MSINHKYNDNQYIDSSKDDISNIIEECKSTLSDNLKRFMSEKHLSQSALSKLSIDSGYSISQGTISDILNGKANPGLSHVVALSSILNVSVNDLLSPLPNDEHDKPASSTKAFPLGDGFIKDPSSTYMKPYLGDFNVVFFKTSGNAENEEKLVYGLLKLGNCEDKTKTAELRIFLNDRKTEYKTYTGYFYISPDINTAYIFFLSDRYHEISLITFHYIYSHNEKINIIVAAALTTASGSNRYPTMHRMIFSRMPFSPEILAPLKGQLRMNDMNIYLTREQIIYLCNETDISSTLKRSLHRVLCLEKYKCVCIPENALKVENEIENERNISIIRSQSKAQKYNKIGSQTNDTVFHLLDKNQNNPK